MFRSGTPNWPGKDSFIFHGATCDRASRLDSTRRGATKSRFRMFSSKYRPRKFLLLPRARSGVCGPLSPGWAGCDAPACGFYFCRTSEPFRASFQTPIFRALSSRFVLLPGLRQWFSKVPSNCGKGSNDPKLCLAGERPGCVGGSIGTIHLDSHGAPARVQRYFVSIT